MVPIICDSKPSQLNKISPARIAIWDQYGGTMPSGWMRYLMEKFDYTAKVVFVKDIDSTNLKDNFDVLILVGGAIPAYNASGNVARAGRDINKSEIPAEFHTQLGRISTTTSIPQLKKFAEQGGTIVAIGSSTQLAYHFQLPVSDALIERVNGIERKLPNEKYYIPGSVLQVRTNNQTPAGWGMSTKTDIYFDASPVFIIQPIAQVSGQIKPLAWFADATPLRSGWAWGQGYLSNGIAAFEAGIGKGKLLAFGPEINFRAQTYGTFKWLFNQLYIQ